MTTEAAGRKLRRPAQGPGSLLEIAVGEFNARGYDATSMEDLSRAAGITKSSFYHHFSGKEALLRAALERAIAVLFAVLELPGAADGPPVERLRHIVRGQVNALITDLPYVTLLLRVRGNTETERWALQRRREFDTFVAGLVRAGVDEGDLRADLDPAVVARLLSGTVNSLTEWYRPGRGALSPDELADTVLSSSLAGLRA
jgi:AcrR family transcriptional regulator